MLFEYSLNTFSEMDWKLKNITFNLHADGIREEYITTEYEQKFIERGQPIYRCEALVR
jgi:tRNA (guanine-N7-)-methyltransferase